MVGRTRTALHTPQPLQHRRGGARAVHGHSLRSSGGLSEQRPRRRGVVYDAMTNIINERPSSSSSSSATRRARRSDVANIIRNQGVDEDDDDGDIQNDTSVSSSSSSPSYSNANSNNHDSEEGGVEEDEDDDSVPAPPRKKKRASEQRGSAKNVSQPRAQTRPRGTVYTQELSTGSPFLLAGETENKDAHLFDLVTIHKNSVITVRLLSIADLPPGTDNICPISMEPFNIVTPDCFSQTTVFDPSHPDLCVAMLPCGHKFSALSLLYHMSVSDMR